MVREDYVFRQPDGTPGIYEEFHTGKAIFYTKQADSALLAFVVTPIPLFARVLSEYEPLPKEFENSGNTMDVFIGPLQVSRQDLKETLEERANLQKNLQQCDAGNHENLESAVIRLGDAIESYANAYETQNEMHPQRTYKDIPPSDFHAYFKAFFLKPLNYAQTNRGKTNLLVDFEFFMDNYPVNEHIDAFCETASKNNRSPILARYARIFSDMKKEDYRSVSDRLKKVSSRLQAV